jgi:hypothetical protein
MFVSASIQGAQSLQKARRQTGRASETAQRQLDVQADGDGGSPQDPA